MPIVCAGAVITGAPFTVTAICCVGALLPKPSVAFSVIDRVAAGGAVGVAQRRQRGVHLAQRIR